MAEMGCQTTGKLASAAFTGGYEYVEHSSSGSVIWASPASVVRSCAETARASRLLRSSEGSILVNDNNDPEHNGVLFPDPYDPLPANIKMKYDGNDLDLSPSSEEVATFYAALIESDYAKDDTFNKNFFADSQAVLERHPPRDGTQVTKLDLCDLRPMYEYSEAEKARKKALSSQGKMELTQAKDARSAKQVGNFRVEPPGLFRGRGDHPKKGASKHRVRPEDITINIGDGAPIPVPNMLGQWKEVIHDHTVTWLATWTDNVTSTHKYVFPAASSHLKSQSDMLKFEKARELKNHIANIRQNYNVDLESNVVAARQRATAMYLIDKLGLRAGNETGDGTVGCCSLRTEHLTLEPPNVLVLDVPGTDATRYSVPSQIFANIRAFTETKRGGDRLLDCVDTAALDKHLRAERAGLAPRVFRTLDASLAFQRLLDAHKLENATPQEKVSAYNTAGREAAQRGLRYGRTKLRHALFKIDEKVRTDPEYNDAEADIDDGWVVRHEAALDAGEIAEAESKFAAENERLVEDGREAQAGAVLQGRIAEIERGFERLVKERGTGEAELKREEPVEKVEEAIAKLTERIKADKLQITSQDEVALGTSNINYLDPRITAAWCKLHDVPVEKIFSETLRTRFPWAMEVGEDWKF
ncbi:hypothetical protein DFH07DRAFT_906685 [Mycena maculata]|uniref:DNA topoisomerase 1 n=1 Tax=Mycena maculata TaxID=230809 RepID=A0AAD7MNT1_9AGAR|nr:hypothetical protein DFH07DRAFT_906685 [Mycena maculata]